MTNISAIMLALVMAAATVTAAEAQANQAVKPDSRNDTSAAIQKAMDDTAAKGGGRVQLSAGSYRLDGSITVPSGVTLAGTWEAPHHAQLPKGTVFLVYADKGNEDGKPLVNLSPSSMITGVTFYYPEQKMPDPYPYPWTIRGEGMHCSVTNVTLVNPYKAIDFGTKGNELHYVRNVFGCPLKVGVYIDKCTDIGRVENVHFNPHYWMRAESEYHPSWPELSKYLFDNCIAFDIGRSDWEYMLNTFSFGCKNGYRFFRSDSGECNGNFLGIAADWAKVAVLVEQTQGPGLLITNGEFVGGKGADTMVEVAKSHTGVVQFSNCSFWGPAKTIADVDGPGSVSFSQCNFESWVGDLPAITAKDGDLTVETCRFNRPKKAILLGPDVKTAVIMGNRMTGEVQIENQSKGDVQIGLNVARK